jgi:hypothetical protein
MRTTEFQQGCGIGPKFLIGVVFTCCQLAIPAALAQWDNYNPAYPRIAARPHGTLLSSSAVDADSRHIAKHHVAILATHRTWKLGGFDMATLPAHIKSYNSSIKLFKYVNANQFESNNANANLDWIRKKLYAESGGNGNGDWWKRTTGGALISGSESGKHQVNVTLQTKPDKSGLQWPQWFVRYWNAAPSDSGSWVAPAGYNKGRGLREGAWDGVFQDDQYISTGRFAPSNADLNNDRLNDPPHDERTRNWVVAGHIAVVDEWKKLQPSRLVLGQYAALASASEPDPSPFAGVHDGGLIQDITRKDGQTGGWPIMMKAYRKALSLASNPKIVIFHNQIADLLHDNPDMGVYQANRYGLTSALMDNGYYAVMAPGQLRPEFDEFFGGKDHSVSKLGYLGQPRNGPQTNPWSQGVYRREFDRGLVLVNPKGNGTRTVNVGSGWRRIDGGQDRNHNNGQNASSVTLKEQDGIILIRTGS